LISCAYKRFSDDIFPSVLRYLTLVTWVVPLALGGFAILLMATFTMISARRRHHATQVPVVQAGPRILVHDINDDRCTGCDACVAVCPTNVLDLVSNKSRVLRFADCIQCEACMFACPTEALVMFPEGGQPPPLKVPEIDEHFQTAVPGQYLIGEVAGKPLVKNAANLGRGVIEHMLHGGLRAGMIGSDDSHVDVAIVGSGPGGLSAALSCIQRGLSYVVLEKEQLLASTIARYPKGKLVMAEPYDTANVSLLPVFDSSKEQLIPIWRELVDRVGVRIQQGESVETVKRGKDGMFEVRTTVAAYRAQRVVLSIGTRGKPRTLQVPGENLPKVFSLLDDPDDWRGKNVLVVGGGDSACEAALALADAGAKVIISYRGKSFSRAAPKNKQAIEQYAAGGRIKAKLGSQVLQFEADNVTVALGDGSQKRYPNEGAFVLIGADPPVAWLEKLGVRFVERHHQYQMGKSDDVVRRYVARAADCPEDAARAAAQVLGGSTGIEPAVAAAAAGMPGGQPMSGPRKWLRSATSIFSTKGGSRVTPIPVRADPRAAAAAARSKKIDRPIPLSEFAARQRQHTHTGDGRRDQLSAGERTRILRMLRDEGGRMADEDSQVFVGAPPSPLYDLDFDDSPGPQLAGQPPAGPAAPPRPDVAAKPAVVVGLAEANKRRSKRQSVVPPTRGKPPTMPPPPPPAARAKPASVPPRNQPVSQPPSMRAKLPPPFEAKFEEKTRAVNDAELIAALRGAPLPPPAPQPRKQVFDDPTRVADIDPKALAHEDVVSTIPERNGPSFLPAATEVAPMPPMTLDEHDEGATQLANVEAMARAERVERAERAGGRAPQRSAHEERTRAVDIRNDPSISDIDWDID
jgi:thioredoxin reductase (NADPH)